MSVNFFQLIFYEAVRWKFSALNFCAEHTKKNTSYKSLPLSANKILQLGKQRSKWTYMSEERFSSADV